MLHGDISNQIGTTIAFQCVDTLIKFREHGLKDKLLNTLFGREKRAVINEKVQTKRFLNKFTDADDLLLYIAHNLHLSPEVEVGIRSDVLQRTSKDIDFIEY